MIERLTAACREDFLRRRGAKVGPDGEGLSEDALKAVFCFQLNGCLAVSKQNVRIPDEDWDEIQCSIDRFIKNGFSAL